MNSELENLLKDPRCHRAVADPEMSERVVAHVLDRRAQEGEDARPTRDREATRVLAGRWLGVALPGPARRALLGAGAVALLLGGVLLAARLGWIRRVDLLAKYALAELLDAVRAGLLFAPVTTSVFLAGLACLAGFAALPGARRGWRHAFGV